MFRIITIPFSPDTKTFHDDDLHKFCMAKSIRKYKALFFSNGGNPYWTVFVEYDALPQEQDKRKEETQKLNKVDRMLYEKLKIWRADLARNDGIPVYIIATSQLCRILIRL